MIPGAAQPAKFAILTVAISAAAPKNVLKNASAPTPARGVLLGQATWLACGYDFDQQRIG